MSDNSETAEYEDIIRYEPEPLVFVADEQANNLLWDLSQNPIIRILRQGPMTAREIEAEYNKIAELMCCSQQTVRVHLHRALKRLAHELRDYSDR